MIRLIIKEIKEYDYFLEGSHKKQYKLNIEFYDLPNKPKVGDSIFLSESLLQDLTIPLCIGPIDQKYGKVIQSSDDPDIIVLIMDKKEHILKRYYG